MTTPNFLMNAKNSVERYSEQWKKDHDEAMACLEFEELIAFGVWVRGLIDRVNEIWRSNVERNPAIYDEKVDEQIEQLYSRWLEPAHSSFERIDSFEQKGFDVSGASEFRAAYRAVENTVQLFEGLRVGKSQIDRGERIPFADAQRQARAT